ncbi:Heavy metal-associated domain, HMA [Dillenia turbinata]|uniref:Heavy metal-associated domain, HMA n=1 Tax=Dillenia turbinata TaxID=194707 RepID=A0AAN8UCS6_9MAGN
MGANSSAAAAAAAEATITTKKEETAEPIKYKTWFLKVSVHCEGCKKKIKKILNGIEGVYETEVDVKQQKVTVTGNVDAEALIRKLLKTGKHAELWPEKQPDNQKEKKSSSENNGNNKEKSNEDQKQNQINDVADKEKGKGKQPISKVEVQAQDQSSNSSKIVDNDGGAGSSKTNVPVKFSQESKSEGKKPETGPAVNHSPAPDMKADDVDGAGQKSGGGGGGGGGGGKKKKKKRQNRNLAGEGAPSPDAQAGTELPPTRTPLRAQGPAGPNQSPPRHLVYQYSRPHPYYSPPVNAVSYNTAHPNTNGASYYAAPSPPSHSYHAYAHHPGFEQPQPSDLDNHASRPSDSLDLFSDENPNGCSIV